jgi:hypothetical protein
MFKNCRLALMSDGHYCLLRDLGPVKGAKGMKRHEVVIDFSRRGIVEIFRRVIRRGAIIADGPGQIQASTPSVLETRQTTSSALRS